MEVLPSGAKRTGTGCAVVESTLPLAPYHRHQSSTLPHLPPRPPILLSIELETGGHAERGPRKERPPPDAAT